MNRLHIRRSWTPVARQGGRTRSPRIPACVLLAGLVPMACSQSLRDMALFKPRPTTSGGSTETVDVAAARMQRDAEARENLVEPPAESRTEPAPDPTRTAFASPDAEIETTVRRGPINVIRVNGDEFTVEEILEPILDDLTQAARTQSAGFYRNLVRERIGIQWRRQLERLLVYQEAISTLKEDQIEQLDKHAEKLLKERIQRDFEGVEQKFEMHARERGWSREQELDRLKREAVVSMWVHERFRPRVDVTRAQLKRMYEAQSDRFVTPERRSMMLIDLPYESFLGPSAQPSAREWAAARQNAHVTMDRIREELASGVEFRAAAMQYSEGPNAGAGGVWNAIRRGSLRPRFQPATEVLFTLAEGQVSEPIETDEGLFLVQCTRIEPEERIPFSDAQAEIRKELADRERTEALGEHIRTLMKKATVDQTEVVQFLTAVELAAPRHKDRTAGVQE